MIRKAFLAGLAFAAICGASEPAVAATITLARTLDLTQPTVPGLWQGSPPFDNDDIIALANNDTLDYKIDFVGGQSLTLPNSSFVGVFFTNSPYPRYSITGYLSILDATGGSIFTSQNQASEFTADFFGDVLSGSELFGAAPSATFYGLRYFGTLTNFYDPDDEPALRLEDPVFFATSYSVNTGDIVAAVPEPGTWMMMVLGFGLIGFALRKRLKADKQNVNHTFN